MGRKKKKWHFAKGKGTYLYGLSTCYYSRKGRKRMVVPQLYCGAFAPVCHGEFGNLTRKVLLKG